MLTITEDKLTVLTFTEDRLTVLTITEDTNILLIWIIQITDCLADQCTQKWIALLQNNLENFYLFRSDSFLPASFCQSWMLVWSCMVLTSSDSISVPSSAKYLTSSSLMTVSLSMSLLSTPTLKTREKKKENKYHFILLSLRLGDFIIPDLRHHS